MNRWQFDCPYGWYRIACKIFRQCFTSLPSHCHQISIFVKAFMKRRTNLTEKFYWWKISWNNVFDTGKNVWKTWIRLQVGWKFFKSCTTRIKLLFEWKKIICTRSQVTCYFWHVVLEARLCACSEKPTSSKSRFLHVVSKNKVRYTCERVIWTWNNHT